MIEFYVSGQTLKFFTPVIAADSLNYLTAKVNFADAEWDGYSKWLHFRQDEELGADTYDIQLNEYNEITADQKLNLTVGQWEIYLTGTYENSRLTTVPVILTVQESGLIDAPLHELPMSVAERVDFNAAQALLLAQSVKDKADAGGFDGKDGTSLTPLGHFETRAELAETITNPAPGDVYSVGSGTPYNFYIWDGVNLRWQNHGQIQGVPGEQGVPGVTFIPTVDSNGIISWVNDGGLPNPAERSLKGPRGETGETGAAGKSPYAVAKEEGFTGTEDTFNEALKVMPSHAHRHLPEGADPLVLQEGNYGEGSVKASAISFGAVTETAELSLTASKWDAGDGFFYQSSEVDLPDECIINADVKLSDADTEKERQELDKEWGNVYYIKREDTTLTFYASEKPEIDMPVKLAITKK